MQSPRITNDPQRKYSNQNASALVRVPRAFAKRLLDITKRINVEWKRCRVEERVALSRCFKCQRFAHIGIDCKNEPREKYCIRCGEHGHEVSGCNGEDYCYECQKKKHRVSSMACPVYRDLVKKEKERNAMVYIQEG